MNLHIKQSPNNKICLIASTRVYNLNINGKMEEAKHILFFITLIKQTLFQLITVNVRIHNFSIVLELRIEEREGFQR